MSHAVTLKQLRYLVAVADTLHFGKAADAANISQPSLSAQIQQLEEALGSQLGTWGKKPGRYDDERGCTCS
ncbi:MAG TPA: LysR family transcriptional regulator [Sphingomicrobium sp.]|nr:LysR family transcriptional regulator [Sphingomicrobium sp.]